MRRCNDFLTEQLADQSDRLHAVAVVDFADLDAAVDELEHARDRAARVRSSSTPTKGRPPSNVSPGHPAWDRVWDAATRLGMVAVVHIGNTAPDFTGWADIGWELPDSAGDPGSDAAGEHPTRPRRTEHLVRAALRRSVRRHPTLTVLLEEMRVNWIPPFVDTLSRQSLSSPILGDWPYDVAGGDMLRRNVRVTPLPGLGDTDALEFLAVLPEMCVFSSDFPHQEGNAEPIDLYRPDARHARRGAPRALSRRQQRRLLRPHG